MSDLDTMTDADIDALITERNLLLNIVDRQRAEIAALEAALANQQNAETPPPIPTSNKRLRRLMEGAQPPKRKRLTGPPDFC